MSKNAVICSMDILLIAATGAEIAPLIKHIAPAATAVEEQVFAYKEHRVEVLITGVGMMATAYRVGKKLAAGRYGLAIQAGVAGSYNYTVPPGTVVFVKEEVIGGWGAEDGASFISMFDLGLADRDAYPFANGRLENSREENLLPVSSVSVNTVTGSEETVKLMTERYGADIESMEGAAFHYVCLAEGQPFVQIRAISNYVERRNRAAWQMDTAINNLNSFLVNYLDQL